MFDYKNDVKLYPFEISADGGNTYTRQLMTYLEAVNEFKVGHIVKFKVMQECEDCGALFYIEYSTDGSYEYMNDACECEAEFHPYYSNEPALSEFVQMFRQ